MKKFFCTLILSALSCLLYAQTTAETALVDYINNGDKTYGWEFVDQMRGEGVTAYRLEFTSQKWQDIVWRHELVVIIPDELKHDEALLHISGGSVNTETEKPNLHSWDDGTIATQSNIARRCNAVTAILWQVPRQPLYGGKYEDDLLSYTLFRFMKEQDYSWPLLFPMVKSAVKAMDAIEEFVAEKRTKTVNKFVLNGYSKRGWTTWMTAGSGDKRVVAIAPAVIDILNMRVNVPYQRHMFGDYSASIGDYVRIGLTEELITPEGWTIVKMVDPYSYRKNYTMPKMVMLGSNDPYWSTDAAKNYLNDIPGDSWTAYSVNAGHGLNDEATSSLEAFFHQSINGLKYPRMEYKPKQTEENIEFSFKAEKGLLEEVEIWEAVCENRDFRKQKFICKKADVKSGATRFMVEVDYPESGYKAFVVILKYKHPSKPNSTYNITTRMYTADSKELFDKPYITNLVEP
ncbi:MAG: PhoPQ-activated pathogenicity-like protein PqaA type [Alistipes sp.]|nr:PhoPQ-activated pathogenicity-like protein PqaA type [Alistipes sp.]